MVAKAAELGVQVYAIGGWYDHVHLVVSIPPRRSVAEVVKRLKGASAHFVNRELSSEHHFAWQRSYGVLSLGERQRAMAEAYVLNQKQHHESRTANPWLERCDDSDIGREGWAISARRESMIGERHRG
jgi:putative transposase